MYWAQNRKIDWSILLNKHIRLTEKSGKKKKTRQTIRCGLLTFNISAQGTVLYHCALNVANKRTAVSIELEWWGPTMSSLHQLFLCDGTKVKWWKVPRNSTAYAAWWLHQVYKLNANKVWYRRHQQHKSDWSIKKENFNVISSRIGEWKRDEGENRREDLNCSSLASAISCHMPNIPTRGWRYDATWVA